MELSKVYDPSKHEQKIYQKWEASGFFNPDVCVKKKIIKKEAKPFSIVLPPPNATGALHIGHAMMLAIEDLMTRYHRMKGDRTLWLPGTDHAAIATNAIVEKQLAKEGKTKHDLGRVKYVERVKKYIEDSQENIRNQVRKMGSSLDWSREAYTWDEERNLAVRTMFKKMYDDGLIYRGHRIVNWCPHCQSTLADDEVEYEEQKAKLYTFRYAKNFPFAIATTRPETKLGDTAVAVNPQDRRYQKYIGKVFKVKKFAGGPDLKIKVIADKNVDMKFGTGVLGVTPAHSFLDYEMAQKNNLEIIKVIDEDGKMTANAGSVYAELDVFKARNKVVDYLEKNDLLEKEPEEMVNNLSVCYRCKKAIEPLPSKQWFVDVNKEFCFHQSVEHPIKGLKEGQKVTLKKLMKQVVQNGQIEIIPERFYKIYFHWINNLRDWCISRQIWVGHQIPVWYRDEEIYVGIEAPSGKGWKQSPDTLDTWFSAGLWTFSTLGWPDPKAKDLNIYHPTSVLETMFDILFFWVARMIMLSTYALGEIPFEKVYLHACVLDKDGEKMSKSKPETMIDPLDVCDKYGTDAVRLSLLIGVGPGADVRLSEEKIAGFRNFTNKLWNICRFILINVKEQRTKHALNGKGGNKEQLIKPEAKTLADNWILSRLDEVARKVTELIETFQFSQAGEVLRDFTWGELADWYLEIAKIEGNKSEILTFILNTILKLWHPFMPFVTEAIWQEAFGKENLLMIEKWPAAKLRKGVGIHFIHFDKIVDLIKVIRSLRADYKIDPVRKLNVAIGAKGLTPILAENREIIRRLARLDNLVIAESIEKPANSMSLVVGEMEIHIVVAGILDIEKEEARLKKEIEKKEKFLEIVEKRLSNKEFIKKAPKEIVEAEKMKKMVASEQIKKMKNQLKQFEI